MDNLITTADGHRVGIGDRVYNYYDGHWCTIVSIDEYPQPDTMKGQTSATPREEWDNFWFWTDTKDYLDGSRVAISKPQWAR